MGDVGEVLVEVPHGSCSIRCGLVDMVTIYAINFGCLVRLLRILMI